MKTWFTLICIFAFTMIGCGDDEGCPGMVCTNCAASGDCTLECPSPQLQYCGAFGYFDDPGLRCAYCGPAE